MHPAALSDSPFRFGRSQVEKQSRTSLKNNTILTSFQKNEALVMTDNTNNFSEWPENKHKPPHYQHKPVISKALIKKGGPESIKRNSSTELKHNISSNPSVRNPEHLKHYLRGIKARAISREKRDTNCTPTNEEKESNNTPRTPDRSSSQGELLPLGSLNDRTSRSGGGGGGGGASHDAASTLLMQMEGLLDRVKKSVTPSTISNAISPSANSMAIPLAGQPHNHIFDLPSADIDGSSASAPAVVLGRVPGMHPDPRNDDVQIDWLVRGLPEAYDSEPVIDDEAILSILKEGGDPPDQIALPSVYAANQEILAKLNRSRILRIKIEQLLIFSARYGIRKEGTYFVLHPPSGCKKLVKSINVKKNAAIAAEDNDANDIPITVSSVHIPLPELQDSDYQVAKLLKKVDNRRDSMKNYFVGTAHFEDNSKTVQFELSITDKVMQEWIKCDRTGSIKLEIFSFIPPVNSLLRGQKMEPTLFGSVYIPMGGLLGTTSLDAVLQCDIDADQGTQSLVISRMDNINFSRHKTTKPKPLGPIMGTVSIRMSLLSDAVTPSATKGEALSIAAAKSIPSSKAAPPASDPEQMVIPVHQHQAEVISSDDNKDNIDTVASPYDEEKDSLHRALHYVPTEAPRTTKLSNADPVDAPHEMGKSICGLTICALEDVALPTDTIVSIQNAISAFQSMNRPSLTTEDIVDRLNPIFTIVLKVSSSKASVMKIPFLPDDNNTCGTNISMSDGIILDKIYDNRSEPKCIAVELWLQWNSLDSSSESTRDCAPIEKKLLLGIGRYMRKSSNDGYLVSLPIKDVAQGAALRGNLVLSCHSILLEDGDESFLSNQKQLETSIQASLNEYLVERDAKKGSRIDSSSSQTLRNIILGATSSPLIDKENSLKLDDVAEEMSYTNPHSPDKALHQPAADDDDSIDELVSLFNSKQPVQNENIIDQTQESSGVDMNQAQKSSEADIDREPEICTDIDPMESENISDHGNKDSYERNPHRYSKEIDLHNNRTPPTGKEETVHLLDIAVDGPFKFLSVHPAAINLGQIFGCYVQFSLPGFESQPVKDLNKRLENYQPYESFDSTATKRKDSGNTSLWWDSECPVLNGAQRFKFNLLSNSVHELASVLGIDADASVIFSITFCDQDGNLPEEPIVFAHAELTLKQLHEYIQGGSSRATHSFQLPMRIVATEDKMGKFSVSTNADDHILNLSISHRIEPILLRNGYRSIRDSLVKEQPPAQSLTMDNDIAANPLGFDLTWQDLKQFLPGATKQVQKQSVPQRSVSIDDQGYDKEIAITVRLEEFAHLKHELVSSDISGCIFASITCKVAPEFESVHYLSDAPMKMKSAPYTQLSTLLPKRTNGRWCEQYEVLMRGNPSKPSTTSGHHTSNSLHFGETFHAPEESLDSATVLLKGSAVQVSLFLRQYLFSAEYEEGIGSAGSVESINLTDYCLGAAIIDLSTLAFGLSNVSGWYHIVDDSHRAVGQVKLSVSLSPVTSLQNSAISAAASLPPPHSEEAALQVPFTDVHDENIVTIDEDDSVIGNYDRDTLNRLLKDLEITNNRLLQRGIIYEESDPGIVADSERTEQHETMEEDGVGTESYEPDFETETMASLEDVDGTNEQWNIVCDDDEKEQSIVAIIDGAESDSICNSSRDKKEEKENETTEKPFTSDDTNDKDNQSDSIVKELGTDDQGRIDEEEARSDDIIDGDNEKDREGVDPSTKSGRSSDNSIGLPADDLMDNSSEKAADMDAVSSGNVVHDEKEESRGEDTSSMADSSDPPSYDFIMSPINRRYFNCSDEEEDNVLQDTEDDEAIGVERTLFQANNQEEKINEATENNDTIANEDILEDEAHTNHVVEKETEEDDNSQDDSPDTSKIKHIVDEEIQRIFGPDILHSAIERNSEDGPGATVEEEVNATEEENNVHQPPLHWSVELEEENIMASHPVTMPPRIEGIKAQVKNPITLPQQLQTMGEAAHGKSLAEIEHMVRADNDVFRRSIEQVRTSLPPSDSSTAGRGSDLINLATIAAMTATAALKEKKAATRRKKGVQVLSGQQKRFIDEETERISKIMMGVMQRGF